MDDVLFTSTVVGRPHIVKSHGLSYSIHEAVEGRTVKSLMDKPRQFRHELLTRVGSIFADIHEKGSHGNAQLSNIIYQPNKEIALTSLHRSVIFTKNHSSEEKMACRKYDIMKIVQSLSTTDTIWLSNPNYQTFVKAYLFRLKETYTPTQVGKVFHPVASELKRIFDNKSARDVAKSIHNFYVEKYPKP